MRRDTEIIGHIELSVTKVGNKSLTLSYKLISDEVVCAEVWQVVVAMDLDSHRSVEIPDSLREVLQHEQKHHHSSFGLRFKAS